MAERLRYDPMDMELDYILSPSQWAESLVRATDLFPRETRDEDSGGTSGDFIPRRPRPIAPTIGERALVGANS